MHYEKSSYIQTLKRNCTTGATFTIKSPPLRSGDYVRVDMCSVACVGSKNRSVDLGITTGGESIYFASVAMTIDSKYFYVMPNIYLDSDHRLVCKVVDPQTGELFYCNIFGTLYQKVE